ncbi:methyl-CpG-binding domain protein 2 isoform X3 [Schistocerca americana]|uniref:methyl-CpG-binding domain protein 2 isoform X3 n=1 Tax=Schistocerca americana TaxID=7009 RepID=UPI001F50365E|nr:methyl-CpG-binding domain protein 2 isoform X3 [Schistocerca americana]XP_047121272.1 methyl-CpG-binding domain protein 2 isoform X3 [Schistocerca piceifrons]XP_049764972.1 methyl-CpG-binding domain protein 2 isoform X3 [Schistocerca cancellata]XP_049791891.1 methyl-CpG-binding domain protein 2 isoform X3 [Schistocerca nitens]XP_049837626.1 methyl-CpG-binding domain protein 2 isoform X3 [Schistocerca gregaria]XP_049937695.1 methyl-CpG-binding domain protein 2 isoform X3 [Schistocerca serial
MQDVIGDTRTMALEKRKYECSALPKGWQREEVIRKSGLSAGKVDVYYYSRGVRNDASLVPPIRQTASIFKQPVTVHKMQEGKVKTDFKHGPQEKPKQLFWEKRLEGLRACDLDGTEFDAMELPRALRPVGPHVGDETLLQSVATALHVSAQPVTGQTGSRTVLDKNPGVFLNPEQPLVQAVTIADEDIKRQEERVASARKKLQEALKRIVA